MLWIAMIFASFPLTIFLVSLLCMAKGSDEVTHLPGWPHSLPSKQYSGFLSSLDTYEFHYWMVESEVDPENAPIIFWFNGGPGASSLYGLLLELGPFLLSDESLTGSEYERTGVPQLLYNPYGWQKVASIVAISMPPPVGYSYCNPVGPSASGNDCGSWNDTSTADATYDAIRSFFVKYPELKKNELYLAGESYAGIYVPKIVQNIMADKAEGLNFKGFLVGDACTPPAVCGSDQVGPFYGIEFLYGKSAFSNQLYDSIMATCTNYELVHGGTISTACQDEINKIPSEVGGYWAYAYYDDCWYENDIRRRSLSSLLSPSKQEEGVKYYGPPIAKGTRVTPRTVDVPNGYYCGGPNAQEMWLGLDEVKAALNIPSNAVFFQSDNGVGFTYYYTEADLISWYKEVIAENSIRIMIYNGDTDPCINSFLAQNWTSNLGLSESQSWRPWTTDGCQRMGGYVTRYANNFDFLTIRGAGHMVPQFKSQQSLEFLTKFLKNEDYLYYDASCTAPSQEQETLSALPLNEASIQYELDKAKRDYEIKKKQLTAMLNKVNELQDGNDDGLHRGNDSSEHSNQTCSTDTESVDNGTKSVEDNHLTLPSEFNKKYSIRWILGTGSTSKVYEVSMKNNRNSEENNAPRACKIIDKRKLQFVYGNQAQQVMIQLKKEIEVLRAVNHCNIVSYYEYFETKDSVIVVMERCKGDDLFEYILDHGPFQEDAAKGIIRQILSAVAYLHMRGVIHRDIKAENIILCNNSDNLNHNIKLIDFGFSTILGRDATSSFLGTGGYIAPEMRQQRHYSMGVDIWSCGILLYFLLSGQLPFATSIEQLPQDYNSCEQRFKLHFPTGKWSQHSDQCKDFIKGLLDVNPVRRMTSQQALQNPWLTGKEGNRRVKTPERLQEKYREAVKNVTNVTFDRSKGRTSENSSRQLLPLLTSPLRPIQSVSNIDTVKNYKQFMMVDEESQSFPHISNMLSAMEGHNGAAAGEQRIENPLLQGLSTSTTQSSLLETSTEDFFIYTD